MALILSCDSLSKSYGSKVLFADISMGISDGERIGLIGANGSGKSTLLNLFAGLEKPDSGSISIRRNTRIAYLNQDDIFPEGSTVSSILHEALKDQPLDEIERETEVAIMVGQLNFDNPEQPASTLSGGWRKRLALGRELIRKPDLLFLDEPTNHLDLEGILWLENLLKSNPPFSFILVSHDRYFLENVTTRMIELSRAYPMGYFSVEGSYSELLMKKDELMSAQATLEAALNTKMKREIEWLRRGPQARTTKAQYRIDEAGRMADELSAVRERNSQGVTAKIDFSATGRKTQQLCVVKEVAKELGGKKLFEHLSFILSPGMKLGIIGSNGSGKTTLLKVLAGEIAPDNGDVKHADRLRIVMFDQNRAQLDTRQSLRHTLAGESETVNYLGQSIHVTSWAKRFLFRPEQLESPVSNLSGGEQARVLIANLMLQPTDLLILDEPTNDLDIPSLEVLEESLSDFPGALILVTHDRFMLDRLATELLSVDGKGSARFYAEYLQWERDQKAPPVKKVSEGPKKPKPNPANAQKITRQELRELERIEETILTAEENRDQLHAMLNDPAVVADYIKLQSLTEDIDKAGQEIAALYARWEELEAKKAASA